jgi:hypothetical protein
MKVCELCGYTVKVIKDITEDIEIIECPYCGRYFIKDQSRITSDNKSLLAGYLYMIKNRNRQSGYIPINAEEILKDFRIPTRPLRKLEYLLVAMDEISKGRNGVGFSIYKYETTMEEITQYIKVSSDETLNLPPAFAYAADLHEVYKMFTDLSDYGYLSSKHKVDNGSSHPRFPMYETEYSITMKGYEKIEALRTSMTLSNRVFIALQFKNDDGSGREELVSAIKNACDECGFEAGTVNETPYNGGIADEIITAIKRSKFVIVDYTYANNGAYFEAGYARGIGRPLIRCCNGEWVKKNGGIEKAVHFDERHNNVIVWDNPDKLRKELISHIRATIDGAK